jgi:DNA phosphorothioation-associated putative methyltransferase
MNVGYHASKLLQALLNLKYAKRVGSTIYAHSSVVPAEKLLEALGESPPARDIVFRADKRKKTLAVLHYPDFGEDAHPKLESVFRIHVESGDLHHRSYQGRKNRPILHRKELLVGPGHPLYNSFAMLTRQEEEAGLFAEPMRIGWSNRWEDLLRSKGLRIEGHELKSTDAGD